MNETYKYDNLRSEMLQYFNKDITRVLEIGCGTGKFARLLKEKYNIDTWGIEKDEIAANIARNNLDRIFVGDVDKIIEELSNEKFDAVVFLDVLEHLYDPYSVLKSIRKLLSMNGLIISSIPNIRYYHFMTEYVFKKNWQYGDSGILDFTHIRFFSLNSIKQMFKGAGYEIVKIEGINPTPSKKLKLLNLFTLNYFEDCKYLQFACVAKNKIETV